MHADPQAQAREMVVDVEHPKAGKMRTLGAPVKFHGTPGGVKRAAPLLGQHSAKVLLEAGYSGADVQRLIDASVGNINREMGGSTDYRRTAWQTYSAIKLANLSSLLEALSNC